MEETVGAFPEGVSLDEAMITEEKGRYSFEYIIKNDTINQLKDCAIGWEFHKPVNGNGGGIAAGYLVQPYSTFRKSWSVEGCIKKVQLLYFVNDDPNGRHFYSGDAPAGQCATRRGVVFSEGKVAKEGGEEVEMVAMDIEERK